MLVMSFVQQRESSLSLIEQKSFLTSSTVSKMFIEGPRYDHVVQFVLEIVAGNV